MDEEELLGLSGRVTALRYLRWAIVAIGVAAAVAMAVMWPTGDAPSLGVQPRNFVDATVVSVTESSCTALEVPDALSGCREVEVELSSGPAAGQRATIRVLETQFEVPVLRSGDPIVLLDTTTSPEEFRYSYADFQRGSPMAALVALFVIVVVVFARGKGLRALIGLAASAAVLALFIVPALLRDAPALPVALAGTVVVAYLALYLAHGVNAGTTVALAGTLVSLAVIAVLAQMATGLAHLSGLADEEAQVIRVTAGAIDLRGLLLAGMIVGALGVLDDVTVTQVSTVKALLRARPDTPRRELYGAAIDVGRDHIASTINTLVLAYAGAALPLLLFFAEGTNSIGRNLSSEAVAVEIIRMLVGSIGLVVSVPITTAFAAALLEPPSPGEELEHLH